MEDEKAKQKTEAVKTDLEKLKEANEQFEKELIKAREMRAERQKIEAEQMLGSTAGQPEPKKELSEEDQKKQQAKEFWKGTAIADALEKADG
jgi:hypothetical protein